MFETIFSATLSLITTDLLWWRMHFVFIILVDSAVGCLYVVACSSPSLISSAAIVQGSLFISHLLVGNRLEEDFWAKSGCTPNGPPGTDAVTLHLKMEKKSEGECVIFCDTYWSSGQKQFGGRCSGGSLPPNWWVMAGRGWVLSPSHWADLGLLHKIIRRYHPVEGCHLYYPIFQWHFP